MTYDDLQLSAVLTVCRACGRSWYATRSWPGWTCILCRRKGQTWTPYPLSGVSGEGRVRNIDCEDFNTANKAFELMTLAEREMVLEVFSRLRYPYVVDRFTEAVYVVISRTGQMIAQTAANRGGPRDGR